MNFDDISNLPLSILLINFHIPFILRFITVKLRGFILLCRNNTYSPSSPVLVTCSVVLSEAFWNLWCRLLTTCFQTGKSDQHYAWRYKHKFGHRGAATYWICFTSSSGTIAHSCVNIKHSRNVLFISRRGSFKSCFNGRRFTEFIGSSHH